MLAAVVPEGGKRRGGWQLYCQRVGEGGGSGSCTARGWEKEGGSGSRQEPLGGRELYCCSTLKS